MEKLIEVSDSAVCIDFVLGTKCRTTIRLRSITANAIDTFAFKIQTSSPYKFLVNPPNRLIAPLAQSIIQIILKLQSQIQDSFPRSASGQFLIRNGRVDLVPSRLRKIVSIRVKSILKYQKMILTELSTHKAESFLQVAMSLDNSVDMVSLLLEVGLKDDSATQSLDDVEESKWMDKGWTELHVAATFDQTGEIKRLVKIGKHETLDCKDKDDRSLLFLTPSKGFESCVK
ncbi:ankyrin repeat-containing protein, partial [Tanacetum coccineum]